VSDRELSTPQAGCSKLARNASSGGQWKLQPLEETGQETGGIKRELGFSREKDGLHWRKVDRGAGSRSERDAKMGPVPKHKAFGEYGIPSSTRDGTRTEQGMKNARGKNCDSYGWERRFFSGGGIKKTDKPRRKVKSRCVGLQQRWTGRKTFPKEKGEKENVV